MTAIIIVAIFQQPELFRGGDVIAPLCLHAHRMTLVKA